MFYTLTLPPGWKRKTLAEELGRILGLPVHYTGTPSMAYEIGDYTVTREATLGVPGLMPTEIRQALTAAGVHIDAQTWDPVDDEPQPPTPDPGFNPDGFGLQIRIPSADFTEHDCDKLTALMAAYGPLIGRALGLAHPATVTFEDDPEHGEVAVFNWFDTIEHVQDSLAAQALAAAVARFARQARRIRTSPPQDDNDRFAMRTFLNRLGFTGPEHAATRKALTCRLSGNGAWRYPKPKDNEVISKAESSPDVEM